MTANDNPTSLPDLYALAWAALGRGVGERAHPFHTATLATVHNGRPQARTVVLRLADEPSRTLLCHCDRRSPKAREANGPVQWHVYDRGLKLQVRLEAEGEVLTDGDLFEARWAATPPGGRAAYRVELAPGTPAAEPPPAGTCEPGEAGRQNFAVIRTVVRRMDILWLHHAGHRRVEAELAPASGADKITPRPRLRWLQP